MKIIVTTLAPDMDAPVDPRFGRAACFVAVDGETLAWEAHSNPAVDAPGGAGGRAGGGGGRWRPPERGGWRGRASPLDRAAVDECSGASMRIAVASGKGGTGKTTV